MNVRRVALNSGGAQKTVYLGVSDRQIEIAFVVFVPLANRNEELETAILAWGAGKVEGGFDSSLIIRSPSK